MSRSVVIALFSTIMLTVIVSRSADASCYASFADLDHDRLLDLGTMSTTCGKYEKARQDLFVEGKFQEELAELEAKQARLRQEIEKTKSQLALDRARQAEAGWQYAIDTIKAIDETADSVDDCVRAVRTPKSPRRVVECLDEINDADDAVGTAIDSMSEYDTQQILRKSTEDLIKRYGELQARWEKLAGPLREQRDRFLEMCNVIRSHCLGSVENRLN